MRRRAVLAAAVGCVGLAGRRTRAAATTPTAPRSGDGTGDGAGTDASPPVVDNAGDPERTVVVDVLVTHEGGDPAAGVRVELEDRGGTPDDRYGTTGPNGRLRFLENVGPPPCNSQTVRLPEHGLAADLGCNDGGAHLDHAFDLGAAPSPDPTGVPRSSPPKDAAPSGPHRTDAGLGGWVRGWVLLAAAFLGVTLGGPLVLGALVAVALRDGADEDGVADGSGDTDAGVGAGGTDEGDGLGGTDGGGGTGGTDAGDGTGGSADRGGQDGPDDP